MPTPLSHPNWKTLLWNGLSLLLVAAGSWLLFSHPVPIFFAVTFVLVGITAFVFCWLHPDYLRFLEGYIVLAGFLGSWCFLTVFGGGPGSWDEMLYMNISLNFAAHPAVFNRYGHIYFQRLFFFFSGWDPFLGVRLFWGFLISGASALVYIAIRQISLLRNSRTGIPGGIMGVLLFWGMPKILSRPGITYAEFTCLFFITLSVVIYLFWLRFSKKDKSWLLVLLGVVMFWTFKSKEVGAAVILLPLGLLYFPQGHFCWKIIRNRFIALGAGLFTGLAIMVLLDSLYLNNPFFSFRPASWAAWINFNRSGLYAVSAFNYLAYICTTPILPSAILAFIGYITVDRNKGFRPGEKMIWLLPLGILLFLTLIPFNDYDRYCIPLSSTLAILASYAFLNKEKSPRVILRSGLLAVAIALIFILINPEEKLLEYILGAHYSYVTVSTALLVPVVAILLLGSWILLSNSNKLYSTLILFSIAFLPLASPIAQSVHAMTSGAVQDAFWVRFDPFIQFHDQIEPTPDMTMYVSSDINAREGTAGRDADSMSWMMNLYFRTNTQPEQYTVEPFDPQIILQTDPQYALVLVTEYESLDANTQGEILQSYSLARDPANYLVLLTRLH